MSQLDKLAILLACNAASRASAVDVQTGQPPIIWRGNGVALRCAVFRGDPAQDANLIKDLDNLSSATLVVRKTSAAGEVIITKTVLAAAFNDQLTLATWQARTAHHFEFVLTHADTNQPPVGTTGKLPIYFAVQIQTTEGTQVTIATGTGDIREDGIGEAEPPQPLEQTAFQLVAPGGDTWEITITNDGQLVRTKLT